MREGGACGPAGRAGRRGLCMRSTPDITPHLGSLLKFRHDLHANPELRYEEHRTGDKVAAYLMALGVQVHRGLGRTGVVASIHGRGPSAANPGRSTGLRARLHPPPPPHLNAFAPATHNPAPHPP